MLTPPLWVLRCARSGPQDTVLPTGSHVIATGLADGRILYEALADRIHPIGMLRQDVTYSTLYTYLNCLGVRGCRDTGRTARWGRAD